MALLTREPPDLALAADAYNLRSQIAVDQGIEHDDPEKAALSYKVAQATGTPPTVIMADPDVYNNSFKKELTGNLVKKSPAIQQYVQSDTMAPYVSSDEWAPIWDFTDKLEKMWVRATEGVVSPEKRSKVAGRALGEIPGSGMAWPTRPVESAITMWDSLVHGLYEIGKAPFKAGGLMELETEWAKNALAKADQRMENAGWDPRIRALAMWKLKQGAAYTEAAYGALPVILARVLKIPVIPAVAVGLPVGGVISEEISKPISKVTGVPQEYIDAAMLAFGTAVGFKHLRDARIEGTRMQKLQDTMRQTDPFLKTGKTPPVGMNDAVDHLHIKSAEEALKQLNDVMKAADKVATRERVPELGVKMARTIVGDGHLEIEPQAAAKNIDKLRDIIPDIEEQLLRSAKDGGPVRVRADEYFGRTDKDLHKELAEFIKMDPDGLTVNQAKEYEITQKQPRAEIINENGAYTVYLDGQRSKAFITRQAAEEHLFKVAPEQSLEGGLKQAAGVEQFDYAESTTDRVEIAPPTEMFGKMVLKLPKPIMERIKKLIAKNEEARQERQLAKAQKKVEEERRPEWQQRFDEQIAETWESMKDNAQYIIKQAFDDRIVNGEDVGENIRLDRHFLTPEEQKVIPRNWMHKKEGLTLDQAAGLLGFDSGKTLLNHITRLEEQRGKTSRTDYFLRAVAQEARERMQRKYGDPAEKILDEAMDHVTSDGTFGLAWEHLLAFAMEAGKPYTIEKGAFRDVVITDMLSRPMSLRMLEDAHREMGQAHRDLVKAASKKDWGEVLIQQEKYVYNHVLAEQAKKLNRRVKQVERLDNTFYNREPEGYGVEYTDRIHDILMRTGGEVDRGINDLFAAIGRHDAVRAERTGYSPGLKGFWEEHVERGMAVAEHRYENDTMPNMVIYDKLFDPGWVPGKDMTVGEWTAIADSKQSIAKWGRKQYVEDVTGKKMLLDDLINQIVEDINFFPERDVRYDKLGVSKDAKPGGLRTMWMQLQQLEYHFERIGRYDPSAPLLKFVQHRLIDGANKARVLELQFGRRLNELAELASKINMTRKLPNDILYEPRKLILNEEGKRVIPEDGNPFRVMTEHNLIALMLPFGLRSGQTRMGQSYGSTPELLMDYINTHATQDHWNLVKGIWKIFRDIKTLEDEMNMRISGVPIQDEIGVPLETKFGVMRGEYYPIMNDRGDPFFKLRTDEANRFQNVRARVWDGFEKPRTARDAPVSLDLADLNGHIARRLRALGVKEAVIDAGKVFYDERFQRAMASRFGKDLVDLLEPYLKDVAGMPGWETGTLEGANRFMEAIRRNAVQAVAGFNPVIFMKHAPTALIHAIGEVGPMRLMEAFHHLIVNNSETIAKNESFIYDGAMIDGHWWGGVAEIIGRRHHWNETTMGGIESILSKPPSLAEARRYGLPTNMSVWKVLKQELTQAGSWAIQTADMKIAEAVWTAKYTHEMENLASTNMTRWEAHTEADRLASFAVRKALGSTAITSKPAIMRSSAWYWRGMTAFMGFFNNTLMRLTSSVWRIGDARREFQQTGDGKKFMSEAGQAGKSFMFYFALTAAVEQMAEEIFKDHHDPTWYRLGVKPFLHLGFQIAPMGRSVFAAMEYGGGFNPGMTILDTSLDSIEKLAAALYHPGKTFRSARGQNHLVGLVLDYMAAVHGIGTLQTSNAVEAMLNMAFAGEVPTEMRHFMNQWRRGTIRDPKRRH